MFFILAISHDFKANLSFQNGLYMKSAQEVHEKDLIDFLSKFIGFQQIYKFSNVGFQGKFGFMMENFLPFPRIQNQDLSYIYSKIPYLVLSVFAIRLETLSRSLFHICQHKRHKDQVF